MRGASALVWTGAGLICIAALGVSVSRALEARSSVAAAAERFALVSGQVQEIAVLRASTSTQALPTNAAGGALATRVTAALASCGLPPSVLGNLSPQADTVAPIPDSASRSVRRRVVLNLKEVTLPKLGSFLEVWRQAEPDWVPTSMDLTPTTPKEGFPGGDLPLNVTLTLDAHFLDGTGNTR